MERLTSDQPNIITFSMMAATPLFALTKGQLETDILLEVVTHFVNSTESTSRHSLVVKFEGQPVGQVLFELMNRNLLQRPLEAPVPTAKERYLPGALAFEFCGQAQFREDAKLAATVILHTLRKMYRKEGDKEFIFEDLERYAAETFPDKIIDSTILKLGLYLVRNFGWLSQPGLAQNDHVSPFRVSEWVMSIANPDTEWEAIVARSAPKAPEVLEGFAPAEDESALAITHQTFFPAGSQHDAYVGLREIFAVAKQEILIVDPYVDQTLWELLTNTGSNVNIQILTDTMKGDFRLEAQKFADQYKRKIEIRNISTYHDRFVIADSLRCWHIGASIKDAGNKAFAFSELLTSQVVKAAISDVNTAWAGAALVAQVVPR